MKAIRFNTALKAVRPARASIGRAIHSERTQGRQNTSHEQESSNKRSRSSFAVSFGVAATVFGAAAAYQLISQDEEQRQTSSMFAHAAEAKADWDKVRKEIEAVIKEDENRGPTFVRLAWHASGTYSIQDKSGGSDGGRIRHEPEAKWGANAGLDKARAWLEKVKQSNPSISYADLYTFAGVVAVESMGGPKIRWTPGRSDEADGKKSPPNGRLPDADKGEKPKTTQHIRDIFYRMGFNDQQIVALCGAHALGRCHTDASGYDGPWTNAPTFFSNDYFRLLLDQKWTVRKWNGPLQYEDQSKTLMMLPADIALIEDPEFRKYVQLYANDEQKFFQDFSSAFSTLLELGVNRASSGAAVAPAPAKQQSGGILSWLGLSK